ncbi:hypothetical protein [Brevibacillus borstelensis]|uniref:hypothetical protein n=1 Tax=Brevibacillus borstelensis TaxID=45462 RepID=UPI002E21ECEA|nr:hypothetical protein [Brevibacillus borstelensis]
MSLPEDKKPVYDERVNAILRGLAEGKSRDELAAEFGYKNYKSLDIYMRRKNFIWDRVKQTYVPEFSRVDVKSIHSAIASSPKVASVLSFFEKEGADPVVIAKQLGFSDHREMADYMKGKGYEWSTDKKNYVQKIGLIEETGVINGGKTMVVSGEAGTGVEPPMGVSSYDQDAGEVDFTRFLPLLELMERNKEKLFRLILPGPNGAKLPRYMVPGILTSKTIHVPNTLDNLVKEYAKEKNINQRDVFEVALIDFFRRYGYEREIDTLLGER